MHALSHRNSLVGEQNVLDRRNIKDAMSKGAECHAGMAYVRLVREHDFEDGEVADDGS